MPVDPGSEPVISLASTGHQIFEICYAHNIATSVFNEYDRTDKSLCPIIFSTVDDMVIHSLGHKSLGYRTNSTCSILYHLYATYANILSADLQDNDSLLQDPYDANQPIESLLDQVENSLDYASIGNAP